MPIVKFVKQNKEFQVNSGNNVRKLARKNHIQIYQGLWKYFNCHGFGLCGTCVVEIDENHPHVSPKRRVEDQLLDRRKMNGVNRRLACQCQVYGEGDVEVKTLS